MYALVWLRPVRDGVAPSFRPGDPVEVVTAVPGTSIHTICPHHPRLGDVVALVDSLAELPGFPPPPPASPISERVAEIDRQRHPAEYRPRPVWAPEAGDHG